MKSILINKFLLIVIFVLSLLRVGSMSNLCMYNKSEPGKSELKENIQGMTIVTIIEPIS